MNSQRILNTLLALFVILLVFTGCKKDFLLGNKFLAKPPSLDLNEDSIFSNSQRASALLNNLYSTLPYGLPARYPLDHENNYELVFGRNGYFQRISSLTDIASDWTKGDINTYMYSGRGGAAQADGNYTIYKFTLGVQWKAFYEGWTLVNNIDRVPDMDQATKDWIKAQAKMIMAIHYAIMFKNIGGVPWIGKAYKATDDLHIKRLTVMESVDSICGLIDQAAPDLPVSPKNVNKDAGRMTRTGAYGLKARILLFAASPLLNNDVPYMQGQAVQKMMAWTGGYRPELWKRCAEAAKKCIDLIESSSYYKMVEPVTRDSAAYRVAFRKGYWDRGTGEILISTRQYYKINNTRQNKLIWTQKKGWANFGSPTQNYVEMFPDKNGVPIKESPIWDPHHPYRNRDPRFYETITSNISMWGNRRAEMYIGGRENKNDHFGPSFNGYMIRKFAYPQPTGPNGAVHHVQQWPFLRIPEVYLIYAEALNEIHHGPTTEAYKYINKVRNRVGLRDIQLVMNDPGSYEEFIQAVLKERILEFGFEGGKRWYDMCRRKRKDVFMKTLYGMRIYKHAPDANGNIFTYKKFNLTEIVPRYWQTHFSPKYYLRPLGLKEVNKGYGLVQNPGW